MVVQLRSKGKKGCTPELPEYETSRKKLGASAYLGHVNAEMEARQTEIQSLKAEIKE